MLEERYQKDPSIVSREIAGEVLLVPIRRKVGDLESIYTLNETAALAWDLFDGQRTLDQICGQIITEYDVAEEEARQDLFNLVAQLQELKAIQKV